MRLILRLALVLAVGLTLAKLAAAAEPLKALIVDGQNNHGNWPQTTQMM